MDDNECQRKNPICLPAGLARCENTPGSFRCFCIDDKTFQLSNLTCISRSRCKETPLACGFEKGDCVDQLYPKYKCACYPGYISVRDPEMCIDVDECQDTSMAKICTNQFADCINMNGSYRCQCRVGFYYDTGQGKCRVSAFAFELEVDFANNFQEGWADNSSFQFADFLNDANIVFNESFGPENITCQQGKFAGVQMKNLTRLGQSYTKGKFVINFSKRVASTNVTASGSCTIEAVTEFVRKRLPELCDEIVDGSGKKSMHQAASENLSETN